jgi:hypothetical protein
MNMMNARRARGTLLCSLFLTLPGFANSALAADGDETPPAEAPESTALSGGGFALDFKVWRPTKHLDPKSLSVTYDWGAKGPRTVQAQRQNDRWHVEFPDQPKPNEQASLKLRYAFALSDADKKNVIATVIRVERAILSAITRASDKAKPAPTSSPPAASPPGASGPPAAGAPPETATTTSDTSEDTTAFDAAFAELAAEVASSPDANMLRNYGTSSGQDGLSYVLTQLGISVSADGVWTLERSQIKKLVDVAKLHRRANTSEPLTAISIEGATATDEEKACQASLPAAAPTAEQATDVLRKCAATLEALATKAKKDEKAAADLVAAAQAARVDTNMVNFAANSFADATLRASYSFAAVRAASEALRTLATNEAQAAHDGVVVKDIDEAFENGTRIEDGATLVEGAAQPRRYDVATGVVFVSGIQDIVVPSLISVCGFEGCLRQTDVAWNAKHGWGRALSFDAGIRVKTLDTQDRRHSDKLSFLTGLSYNPVSVLRVSGGFYWFENAQTKNWTGQPYVGVTVNLLNAAELLGSLGLGDQVAPSTSPVNKSGE